MKELESRVNNLERAVDYIAGYARNYGSGLQLSQVLDILNPPNPKEFLECDTCRAKPGSPDLCKGCLHNRALIEKLTNK